MLAYSTRLPWNCSSSVCAGLREGLVSAVVESAAPAGVCLGHTLAPGRRFRTSCTRGRVSGGALRMILQSMRELRPRPSAWGLCPCPCEEMPWVAPTGMCLEALRPQGHIGHAGYWSSPVACQEWYLGAAFGAQGCSAGSCSQVICWWLPQALKSSLTVQKKYPCRIA